jgi:hypothetical protein
MFVEIKTRFTKNDTVRPVWFRPASDKIAFSMKYMNIIKWKSTV